VHSPLPATRSPCPLLFEKPNRSSYTNTPTVLQIPLAVSRFALKLAASSKFEFAVASKPRTRRTALVCGHVRVGVRTWQCRPACCVAVACACFRVWNGHCVSAGRMAKIQVPEPQLLCVL
jgi:hypothetical protein